MTCEDAIAILRSSRAELIRRGVQHVAVFGSTVRGEATSSSDVDVMLEFSPDADLGVYEYVALARYIGERFPVRVDVVNRATPKPHVRPPSAMPCMLFDRAD